MRIPVSPGQLGNPQLLYLHYDKLSGESLGQSFCAYNIARKARTLKQVPCMNPAGGVGA